MSTILNELSRRERERQREIWGEFRKARPRKNDDDDDGSDWKEIFEEIDRVCDKDD